jgi:dipeptide transport system ATP-binding protein
MTSLNPVLSVGRQIGETLQLHEGLSAKDAEARAVEALTLVGIPEPAQRLSSFPHQMSGGQSQRVMIAMALACNPKLLIADEPTTALDVTVQAQILELLRRLQRERGMALLLITHDLAVVAEMAHRVIVMYAGKQVETGPLPATFERPHHPYTEALLAALPEHNAGRARLATIPGVVPGALDRPAGCLLAPRCAYAVERCHSAAPGLTHVPGDTSPARVRCFFPRNAAPDRQAAAVSR